VERRKPGTVGRGESEFKAATQLRVVGGAGHAGYRLIGIIDSDNASEFAGWLARTLDGTDVHLHLGTVEFRDTSGIRELIEAARKVDGGGRLILHELPDGLTATMRAVGWSDLPGVVIADRREADA
jgi:anti-anti-sigma regulatory factor